MISSMIKSGVKAILKAAGFRLTRIKPYEHLWLKKAGIRTVLDIGANTGQFALRIHELIPEAAIYSFEPLQDCYEQLCANERYIKKFRAFRLALGEREGETVIHRSAHSPSSSLLPMAALHADAFPHTARQSVESVRMMRLDDVVRDLPIEDKVLIKIDVQGYEDKVIAGGHDTIRRASIVIVEASFRELYKGQILFGELFDIMRAEGFTYAGSLSQLESPLDGSFLQADCIFLRNAAK